MFYDEVALEKKLTRRLKNVRRLERKLIRIKSGLSRLVILHRIDLRVWGNGREATLGNNDGPRKSDF